jgi:ketosteroid isomerase-like protein
MSKENVEIVQRLMAGTDADLVPLVRDDQLWAVVAEAAAPLLDPGFEIVGTVIGTEQAYRGIDGFREFMLDWLAPWDEYRSEVAQTIDRGEQVIAIFRISGRRDGSAQALEGAGAWIWTVTDGKVARIVGYADPDEALRVAGIAT